MNHVAYLLIIALWCMSHPITGLPADILHDDDLDLQQLVDERLDAFLNKERLAGATVGILMDDKLVYAAGRGFIREHETDSSALLPILDLSKLITAVAVLQLVEKGQLRLTDRVFGKQGILYFIKPNGPYKMDPRLHHITIEHLLQHTAGFDESLGPVFDPMLNSLYLREGLDVIDIASEVGAYGLINQDDILRFMVSRPLPMKPGTKVMHSNFGYSILGRIIEEVADVNYEDYVQENILHPAGMWHTRIGPSQSDTYQRRMFKDMTYLLERAEYRTGYVPLASGGPPSIFDAVPAEVLDSTLGWHSNVFDMARFYIALLKKGNNSLIKAETAEILFQPAKLNTPLTQNDQVYDGIVFSISTDGTFWHISDSTDLGISVLLYHKPSDTSFSQVFGESSNYQANDLTMIFFGIPIVTSNSLGGFIEEMLNPDILPSMSHNGFKSELSQVQVSMNDDRCLVMYSLPEHRLVGYSNAMRLAGYYPTWIHGFRYDGRSLMVTIFQKATKQSQLDFDVSIHKDKLRAMTYIGKYLQKGYHLSQLQSYHSMAHDGQIAHVCLMAKEEQLHSVEFDIDADLDSYFNSLDDGIANGYIPSVQSIEVVHKEERATYIMSRVDHNVMPGDGQLFMAHHDLTLVQLEKLLKDNSMSGYHLVHLDTHIINHEAKFSALFHPGFAGHWLFQSDIAQYDLEEVISKHEAKGYIPRFLVGYVYLSDLYYAGFWVKIDSSSD